MFARPAGAAWVRRVVDKDGLYIGVDLGLKVSKVDFPVLLGVEAVEAPLHAQVLADRLTKWKARCRHKDLSALLAKCRNRLK